jgi:predicted nucleotidyltransferase
MKKRVLQKIKEILLKDKEILFCYLFGSQTTKNVLQKSDIDLAIYLDKDKNFFKKRLELINKLSISLKTETDIVILNTTPVVLKYVILKEGKLIFERNQEKRVNFELKSFNEYYDFKPILKRYYERILSS